MTEYQSPHYLRSEACSYLKPADTYEPVGNPYIWRAGCEGDVFFRVIALNYTTVGEAEAAWREFRPNPDYTAEQHLRWLFTHDSRPLKVNGKLYCD